MLSQNYYVVGTVYEHLKQKQKCSKNRLQKNIYQVVDRNIWYNRIQYTCSILGTNTFYYKTRRDRSQQMLIIY